MICAGCQADHREGRKFCGDCGASLALPCSACLLEEWRLMRPVEQTPFLRGHNARFRARLAAGLGEDDEVEQLYRLAVRLFEGLQMPYYTAVARAELAEWLVAHARGGDAELLLDQSRDAFQHLQAAPWLERLSTVTAGRSQPTPTAAE